MCSVKMLIVTRNITTSGWQELTPANYTCVSHGLTMHWVRFKINVSYSSETNTVTDMV